MANEETGYLVDVIGFNETERLMLSSIFGLAARRDPSFQQRDPNSARRMDLYLVDADNDGAMAEFLAIRGRAPAPAVLIGASDRDTGLPLLSRPLQWARVLQSFDDAVQGGAPLPSTENEKTMVLQRTSTGIGARTPAPGAGASAKSATNPAARPAAAVARPRRPADAVLVVDDNATVRKFMETRLAPYGFNVDFAETGEQAVGLTGTKEYTCVFLDVVLPGIDGYQVCKLIKGNKQAVKRTAVVMLTSRSSPFDKLRGSLAGCDEYLTKPVDENHLLEVIAKFLPSARSGGA
jgi:twitching motility two-component system response regulator PilG